MLRRSPLALSVQTMRLAIPSRRLSRCGFRAHSFPIVLRQAEICENLIMRDGRVILEPFVRFGNRFRFGLTQSVAILLRRDHCFQQVDHSGKLRRGQLVK